MLWTFIVGEKNYLRKQRVAQQSFNIDNVTFELGSNKEREFTNRQQILWEHKNINLHMMNKQPETMPEQSWNDKPIKRFVKISDKNSLALASKMWRLWFSLSSMIFYWISLGFGKTQRLKTSPSTVMDLLWTKQLTISSRMINVESIYQSWK